MARAKSFLTIQLEYYPVRALGGALSILPMRWARALGYNLLKLVLFFLSKRRRLMNDNIQRALPDLTPSQVKTVAHASLDNIARGLTVLARMPRLFASGKLSWLDIEGLAHLEDALKAGKGVMPITAHYGCWDMMSAWTMFKYPKVAAVYRALDNPRIDAYVKTLRSSSGGTMIERHDILRQASRWYKENGIIGFLIDQNFADGEFVEFFGRPAATTPIISLFARRTGAAIIPVHNRWEGDRLRIIWEKPLALSQNPDVKQAVKEDTQAMTRIVERWVREDPGQWMWLHNRWKNQPS